MSTEKPTNWSPALGPEIDTDASSSPQDMDGEIESAETRNSLLEAELAHVKRQLTRAVDPAPSVETVVNHLTSELSTDMAADYLHYETHKFDTVIALDTRLLERWGQVQSIVANQAKPSLIPGIRQKVWASWQTAVKSGEDPSVALRYIGRESRARCADPSRQSYDVSYGVTPSAWMSDPSLVECTRQEKYRVANPIRPYHVQQAIGQVLETI
ncbi:hypothetical protein I302_108676 [Kwoniella bestiolae CBS 10118]|uniref:Uncharacterized protein n=1 Tax=Kwoniella bestiolae CBS 10118 TaxID=1296100 RepID=A0A1B9FTR0_9TREE|nr:hypothetical protein I302_07811 [Kwoniella bestiolae CBS 10118]OCF22167.1 hypothetical protein I302_07811 [Kwoniella bestiolae CBS 10118]